MIENKLPPDIQPFPIGSIMIIYDAQFPEGISAELYDLAEDEGCWVEIWIPKILEGDKK